MGQYYNGDEILSRHFNFNFICGDRFGGKSTWAQRYVIKRAIRKYKGISTDEFAILTRYDKDIRLLCNTYFDNTMEMFYPDFELIFKAGCFYLKQKDKEEDPVLVGYGFALNQATKLKSTSYPFITTMILEEFMNLEGKYIKNAAQPDLEVELLISLYSTIARGNGHQVRDNVRVFGISNNFYINNPYFRYFGLIDDIVQNPFKRFYVKKNTPNCIVEMTHNDVRLNVGRDDINKGNKFIDLQNDIKTTSVKPKSLKFQLSFDNKKFLSIAAYNDGYVVFEDIRRDDYTCFSCCEIMKAGIQNIKVAKCFEWFKNLKTMMLSNEVLYYDKLESYITFYDIMMFC